MESSKSKNKVKEKKETQEISEFADYAIKQHSILNKESAHLSPDERLKVNQAIHVELKNAQIAGKYISVPLFANFRAEEVAFLKNEFISIIKDTLSTLEIKIPNEKAFLKKAQEDYFDSWERNSKMMLEEALKQSKKK